MTTTRSYQHQRMPQLWSQQSFESASIRMPRHWLIMVRRILRDLKRANNAKLRKPQLEQLHVTIHQTNKLSGLENIGAIGDFLRDDRRRKQTHCMVALFDLGMSAQFCSEYVSSLLVDWITENLSQQTVNSVRIDREPKLYIQNDTYSDGVRAEMTALSQQETTSGFTYISVVIRRERQSDTLITSAELYTLFSMAAKQASGQPLINSLQVRMLVIYSRWVQIVTAKTTRSYVASIVEGWEDIADQIEVYQTPWFNFIGILGQQRVLLFALEATELQSPFVKKPRAPLRDVEPSAQNSNSPKRKLDSREEHGNKRRRENIYEMAQKRHLGSFEEILAHTLAACRTTYRKKEDISSIGEGGPIRRRSW